MNFVGNYAKTARQLLILFLFAGITACGGGGGSSASPPVGSSPPPPPAPSPQDPGEEIIDNEDKSRPLSDDAIVDALQKDGIDIKRRTVAKYREQLGILSARMRKQF